MPAQADRPIGQAPETRIRSPNRSSGISSHFNSIALHDPFGGVELNSTSLPEDVYEDCIVDMNDIQMIVDHWNQPPAGQARKYDLNDDGLINIVDVQRVATRWGDRCEQENAPAWLAYLNTYRALAGVPPAVENAEWSEGAWLHSRYMVKNDVIDHTEDPNNPWYTEAGAAAGRSSNVMVSYTTRRTDEQAIDRWMAGPFHAIGIIDPRLSQTGFGSYREEIGNWRMGATLDVLRGLGALPATTQFPIMLPGHGKTMFLTRYDGGEWPDPLPSCPGYGTPTGPPIMLQLAGTPNVTGYALRKGSSTLAACLFDETSYVSGGDAYAQQLGRNILAGRHAIVLMPREPLTAGQYTVSITANGTTYTWSFNVAGTAALFADEGQRIPDLIGGWPDPSSSAIRTK